MAPRHHYTQDDVIHRMLEKELDHRCDNIKDESIFNHTLPSQYILQFTECIHGTNRNVILNIWFS
jgi:hypothetical protein